MVISNHTDFQLPCNELFIHPAHKFIMQAAKEAVSRFTSNRNHSTEVDEVVGPAVTKETVKPHTHEERQEAVDREVHQHHYHTTVQPIAHQERLPEKHVHNQAPVEHREIRHEQHDRAKDSVAADLAAFKSSSTTAETTHSTSAAPTVTGEHVHHHGMSLSSSY
jgi:hypothetical protein